MRSEKLTKKQDREGVHWDKALVKEKNYIMYKRGYKHMLSDLEYAKKNIQKYQRGLSIFDDQTLRKLLTSQCQVPLF